MIAVCYSYVFDRSDFRKRWSDGRGVRLEDMLHHVLLGLVAVGAALRRQSDERRAEHERCVEQQRQRAEAERLARVEAARAKGVLDSARSLEDAEAVRRLVAAVKRRTAQDGGAPVPGLDAWLSRAEAVAAGLTRHRAAWRRCSPAMRRRPRESATKGRSLSGACEAAAWGRRHTDGQRPRPSSQVACT